MSKKGVSYGSVSQVSDTEADIFDSNDVSTNYFNTFKSSLNAGGHGRLKKTAQSLIGTHRLRKPKPTARTRFDGWLRRDYSVKGGLSPGLMTSSQIRNLTGTSRGDKILDAFLGPTDHTIQNLIRSSGGLGKRNLKYWYIGQELYPPPLIIWGEMTIFVGPCCTCEHMFEMTWNV